MRVACEREGEREGEELSGAAVVRVRVASYGGGGGGAEGRLGEAELRLP